ncbi:MAG: hypothetical protein WC747_03360 [Candidatus Babeliales bacterium]|jgi:hypothetical protein
MIQRNTLLLIGLSVFSLNIIASETDFLVTDTLNYLSHLSVETNLRETNPSLALEIASVQAVVKIQSRNQLSREIINQKIEQARFKNDHDANSLAKFYVKRTAAIKTLQAAIDEAEAEQSRSEIAIAIEIAKKQSLNFL